MVVVMSIIYKFTIIAKYEYFGHKPYYVGQHSGNSFDSYWGSGSIWNDFLNSLKKKYPDNWKRLIRREVLWSGECSQKTLDKLEEIYIRKERAHYSCKNGGCNVLWGTANNFGSGSPSKDILVKKKISKSRKGKCCGEEHFMFGKHWDENVKKKNSISNIGKQSGEKHWHFGKHWSDEIKKKIGIGNSGKKPWLGKHHTEETKRKLSEHFTGKTWSEESKRKMSKSVTGNKNPMYGKMRITNGVENRIIDSNSLIPDGWRRGITRKKSDEND